MDKFLIGLVGVIAGAALGLSLLAVERATPAVTDLSPQPVQQMDKYGSAGQDQSADTITQGGMTIVRKRQGFYAATTTPCIIKSPAATSTIEFFGVQFTVGSTTNKQIILATGSGAQASTTVIGNNLLLSGARGSFYATTTTLGNMVIGPNTYLNLSMVGGTGVDSPSGSCEASFYVF